MHLGGRSFLWSKASMREQPRSVSDGERILRLEVDAATPFHRRAIVFGAQPDRLRDTIGEGVAGAVHHIDELEVPPADADRVSKNN
jgi:hypothetical protein